MLISAEKVLWSHDLYRENYIKCYEEVFNNISLNTTSYDLIRTGGRFIYTERFHNSRAIFWEILNDTVCFTEEFVSSNATQLCNNSVLVRVGASPILEIFIDSSVILHENGNECFTLSIYVVQQDGNINTINIEYHSNPPWYSSLGPLVELKEGKLVYLCASKNINISGIGYNRNSFNKELSIDNNSIVIQNSSTCLVLSSASVESIPVDRDIICVSWISSSLLVFGLSAGDLLLVYISPHNRIREQLLKDSRGSLVQVLWSEFIGNMPSFNFDTICVSSLAAFVMKEKKALVLAVNRSGEIRVWNVLSKQQILQCSIYDLFETCGGFQTRNLKHTDNTKSSGLLESCLLRLGFDQWTESVIPFNIGALAILSSNYSSLQTVAIANPFEQPHDATPHSSQPSWQIILIAWQNTDSTFPGYGDKMRLIAKPITFPLYANQKRTDQYSNFLFKTAHLIDLQMIVDSQSSILTIVSVWRVVASRISPVNKAESKVVFESIIGKVVIPLDPLRSTNYENNGTHINELGSFDMVLISDNLANNQRHSCTTFDEILKMQTMQRKQEPDCDNLLSYNMENTVKRMMMKRIFVPNRFSNKAIYMTYISFKTRFAQILDHQEEVDTQELFLINSQLIQKLPYLVLNICERIAKAKAQLSDSSLINKFGKDNVTKYTISQSDHIELLLQTFSTFLLECEVNVCRLERVQEGCLLLRTLQHKVANRYDLMLLQCGGVRNIIKSDIPIKIQNIFLDIPVELTKIESIFETLEREMSDVFTVPFLEINFLIFKYFEESTGGNQLSSNAFWINDFFRTLSISSLQSVSLNAIGSIRSLCTDITQQQHSQSLSFIDCLLDIDCSKQTLQEFSSRQWNRVNEISTEAVKVPSTAYIYMIFQLLIEVIQERIDRCKLSIIVLFYLQEFGFAWLSSELYADIKNVYIPKAINQLLYFTLLLWFNNLRPVNNAMLTSSIEISSLFPLSSSMSGSVFINKNTNIDNNTTLVLCNENKSVFENFIIYICQTYHDGNLLIDSSSELITCNALKFLLASLYPSVQGDFAKYLFCSGQYICLSRWATMIGMRYSTTYQLNTLKDNYHKNDIQPSQLNAISDFNSLMQVMVRYRILVTQLIAEYYEIVRDQWYQLQRSESMISYNNIIEMKAMELMNANVELENLSYLLKSSINDAVNYDNPASEMKNCMPWNDNDLRTPYDFINNILESKWKFISLRIESPSNDLIQYDIEGCLVMRDIIDTWKMSANKRKIDNFYSNTLPIDENHELSIRSMLVDLCNDIYVSASADIIEILDRSSSLFPSNIASSIVCNGIEKHINFISNLLKSSDDQTSSYIEKLLQELYHSWSRIFEYLLVAGNKYEQALEAIIRLAEVEAANGTNDRVSDTEAAKLTSCKECLQALVAQACSYGKLDWLCSIPLNMTITYSGKLVSLSDAIANTLEDLANALDIIDERKLSYEKTSNINYFECLYVYLLSRQNYREASRIMHVYNARLENDNVHKLRQSILHSQIRTLAAANQSLKILPSSQSFILCTPPKTVDLQVMTFQDLTNTENLSHEKVELIDNNSLSLLFFLKYCLFMFLHESELLYNINSIEISSATECLEKLVLSLCSIGRYQEALSLTQLYDNVFNHYHSNLSWLKKNSMLNRSMLASDLTNIPIIALARESVLYYSRGNALKTISILKDSYLKCPLNPIMTYTVFYEDYSIEKYSRLSNKEDVVLWRSLISTLSYLQSTSMNCSSTKWYAVALRAGLSTVPYDNDNTVLIPLSFLDIYGGFSKDSRAVGDPTSLLLLLLEFRQYECACKVAIQLIKQYHEDLDNKLAYKSSHRIILPYTVFDQIIDLCALELKANNNNNNNNNNRLFIHAQRMKNLIVYHFSFLCTEGL